MIVPNQHHTAEIIISYYHNALGHAGREHILSILRQHYWILNARVSTRRILRQCVSCRRRNETPMTQMMGGTSLCSSNTIRTTYIYRMGHLWSLSRKARMWFPIGIWLYICMLCHKGSSYRRRWFLRNRFLHSSTEMFHFVAWSC